MPTRRRDLEPDYGEALVITIGNGEYFEIHIVSDDGNNTPVPLTNVTAIYFAIKLSPDDLDSEAIVLKTINMLDPDHDLPNGIIALKLDDADTDGNEAGKYYWDLLLLFSSGQTPKNWPQVPGEAILIQPVRRAIP